MVSVEVQVVNVIESSRYVTLRERQRLQKC